MAELQLRNLHKSYAKTQIIHGIDLTVKSGEFCVFVGPSGCGKSTLLRMIAGLEAISDGVIEIDGVRVNDVPAAMRGLAMVFQSYALYPHMSVRQNLGFGLGNLNMPRAEIQTRVAAAASMLQIEPLLPRKPGQLSGGQRQRVAIGRAVVREPKIFLFDEPLSNLDAELRVTMRAEIAQLHKRLGNTMIYVTHDQIEAMTMADTIVVLRDGRLEQHGKPLDLYNRPANKFVAGFIGSPRMNFLSGIVAKKTKDTLEIDCGGIKTHLATKNFTAEVGQSVHLGVRANHIKILNKSPEDKVPEDKTYEAAARFHLQTVEQLGAESFLFGKWANGEEGVLHSTGQSHFTSGDTLFIELPAELTHLFDATSGISLHKA